MDHGQNSFLERQEDAFGVESGANGRIWWHKACMKHLVCHSVYTLEMGKSGASITYLPRMLPEERRKEAADSCRNCASCRQHRAGPTHEPRVHVLFSNNTQNGYKCNSVSMQPLPLSDEPVIETLANDLASCHELPNNEWNIGCNAVAYLDGNHTALASTLMTLREKKLSSLTSQKHLMRLVQLSFEPNVPAEMRKEGSLGTRRRCL